MSGLHHIQYLMSELGPSLAPLGIRAETASSWWIALNEETEKIIGIDYDDAMNRIVISALIGPIQEQAKLKIYEFALQYNLIWKTTGGLRLAVESPNNLLLMLELPVLDLNLMRLETVILNFAYSLKGWREIVSREWNESLPLLSSVIYPSVDSRWVKA